MDAGDLRRERGKRLRKIREALGLDQKEMAQLLNREAKRLRLDVHYELYDVSVRETGRKALDVEDFAAAGAIDARRWPWFWLAFDRKEFEGQRAQPELPVDTKRDEEVRVPRGR